MGDSHREGEPEISEEERDGLHLMIRWSLEYLYPHDVEAMMQNIAGKSQKPIRLLALDCEFVRTIHHADSLARLTVAERTTGENWDIIVKQNLDDICDMRTNITGLTEKSFDADCADLYGVRRKLRNLIADKKFLVILVCHDFRRDLKVLNLQKEITSMGCGLIDTSVIFYYDVEGAKNRKPGLTDLYSMMLNKSLREPDAIHDSVQDCEATLAIFEKALDFVKDNSQRVNLSPPPEITRKWEGQHIFDVIGVNVRTTESDLSSNEHFGQYGDIKRIKFLYNKTHRGYSGRCTVIYHSYVDLNPADVLQGMNEKMIDGHQISVKRSKWSKNTAPPSILNFQNEYAFYQQQYWFNYLNHMYGLFYWGENMHQRQQYPPQIYYYPQAPQPFGGYYPEFKPEHQSFSPQPPGYRSGPEYRHSQGV